MTEEFVCAWCDREIEFPAEIGLLSHEGTAFVFHAECMQPSPVIPSEPFIEAQRVRAALYSRPL